MTASASRGARDRHQPGPGPQRRRARPAAPPRSRERRPRPPPHGRASICDRRSAGRGNAGRHSAGVVGEGPRRDLIEHARRDADIGDAHLAAMRRRPAAAGARACGGRTSRSRPPAPQRPSTAPVSPLIPLGRSTASTGAAACVDRLDQARGVPVDRPRETCPEQRVDDQVAPGTPRPVRPTATSPSPDRGGLAPHPLAAARARRAAAPAPIAPRLRAARAATKPSPPLLPGPAYDHDAACPSGRRATASATARPARLHQRDPGRSPAPAIGRHAGRRIGHLGFEARDATLRSCATSQALRIAAQSTCAAQIG